MKGTFLIAVRTTLVTLLLTGIVYPLVVTGLAQLVFPGRSAGSLVADERGRVVGSELIGQPFSSAAYFQPRPSAAGESGATSIEYALIAAIVCLGLIASFTGVRDGVNGLFSNASNALGQ